MTDDLIKFKLPASFVNGHVLLRSNELAYGYVHGWLDESAVIVIAEHELALEMDLSQEVLELALLLGDERDRVRDIISQIGLDGVDGAAGTWLYLVLAWLFEKQDVYEDPLQVVEGVYADFKYPQEIEGLVRFLPPPQGEATGEDALKNRWLRYLNDQSRHFARRRS